MDKYVSFDIGGTAIKYGIISGDGKILHSKNVDTDAYKGGLEILKKVIRIVKDYQKENEICGVCISTTGMVDVEEGKIIYALPSIVPDYTGVCVKKIIEEECQVPCEVENDVNCIGLAEFLTGAAKDTKNALILAVGTGIGGCIVIDGEVYRGSYGRASEIGYMHIDDGDFQTLGSTSALVRKVAAWKNESETLWNGKRIFDEAREGDALCIRAIDETLNVLGKGIANLCYIINPEIVVLGGGIMIEEDYLKDRLKESINRWLLHDISVETKIAFAEYKNTAGMLGAFYHFKKRREII